MKPSSKKKHPPQDLPIGTLHKIQDFLPSPEKLMQECFGSKKITITLDYETIKSFKLMAERADTKYQTLIREVLKRYAHRYEHR